MKVIIAGSRNITNYDALCEMVLRSKLDITEVVSGGARGVDRMGEAWAGYYNIPIRIFPADWFRSGKAAGYIRNEEMANYADALIALWDGKSYGTANMINLAKKKDLPVYIRVINDSEITGKKANTFLTEKDIW